MGLGDSPMGQFPLGYSAAAAGIEPPDGPAGSRYLNPGSGDYELDDDTRQLKQMPALRQRVLLTIRTALGSSTALPGFGIGIPDRMGNGFERKIAERIHLAFGRMTDTEKVMRIEQIVVAKVSSGRAAVTLVYTDLSTGEQDQVTA